MMAAGSEQEWCKRTEGTVEHELMVRDATVRLLRAEGKMELENARC